VVTSFSDSLLPVCKAALGEDSPLEVLPFGEVVRRFLVLGGEEALPLAQAGHVQAAIGHACGELTDASPFWRSARFPGTHQAIARTLSELREWGLDPHAMRSLMPQASPRLAAKLASLADIAEESNRILALLGRETHSAHLNACLETTPERDGDYDRLLVFVADEDCPTRLRWLEWAAQNGTEVTVVLDRHAAGAPIFANSARAAELLGVEPTAIGDGNRLLRNLFAPEATEGGEIAVSIVSAADPLAEAEWALRGCLEEERLDRTAVYVRNLESYAPLIEAAARRLGVEVRVARRAPLLTNSFARLTLTAIEACASPDVRSLRPILRSSYLGLDGEGQARLASGLKEAHAMRAMQWEALRTWAELHTDEAPWLAILLEWRQRATAGSFTMREWMALLTELIRADERFPWSTRIIGNDARMAERDRRARNQLERLLANHITVDAVTRETSMSLAEIATLCRRLWEDSDVSVPAADFGVCVTDDPTSLGDVDSLHVLGMLEGVFPRRRSEEPVLTDHERTELSALRPEHAPFLTSHDRAAAERDAFYRVCAVAGRRIVFSYPMADDQRDNIPAFYLAEVERAAGGREKVARKDMPRTLLAPALETCLAEADRKLREALDGAREGALPIDLETDVARAAVTPSEEHRFTPNELRDALQCPFQYAARHRLRIRVRRPSARWQTLRRLPQASGLPEKGTIAEARHALMEALEAELDQLHSDVPEWELQALRAGGQRLIREWLKREFRARSTWPKDPGSLKTNVPFGTHGVRDAMPGGVSLDGTLPAVSRMGRYHVAHLYGRGARDPKNLSETDRLYFGMYFLALHEPGSEGALEIESMSGRRELLVLNRAGGPLNAHVQDGLHVVDLSTADDPVVAKRAFFEEVKRSLGRAMARIKEGRIDPLKGDHCDWCDYGELCRRSRAFGEEDSPFGLDGVFEDV